MGYRSSGSIYIKQKVNQYSEVYKVKVEEALNALKKKGVEVKCENNGQTFKQVGGHIVSNTGHKMAESAFAALYSVKNFSEVK